MGMDVVIWIIRHDDIFICQDIATVSLVPLGRVIEISLIRIAGNTRAILIVIVNTILLLTTETNTLVLLLWLHHTAQIVNNLLVLFSDSLNFIFRRKFTSFWLYLPLFYFIFPLIFILGCIKWCDTISTSFS